MSTTSFSDPVGGGSVHVWTSQPATEEQRARARLALMHAGHDVTERRRFLQALGLDQADEIRAQLRTRTSDRNPV